MPDYISASSFGVVGDGVANDYPAMQAFLDALGAGGGLGVLGKGKYFLSSTPRLSLAAGAASVKLIAHGAFLKPDPAQYLAAFNITTGAAVTRNDEARKVVVDGLHIDHFENAKATHGVYINGSTHVVLRDVMINCGSDHVAVQPYPNYAAIYVKQTNPSNGDTGCFWNRFENITVKGASIPASKALVLYGQDNAAIIDRCDFANMDAGLVFQADAQGNIANGVRLTSCDFEGVGNCVDFVGAVPGYTSLAGFTAAHYRVEACGTFFNYLLNTSHFTGPPVLLPNFVLSTPAHINNPNGLTVKVL